ncbi:MAG: GNAT family N-acetyltransferase, partial [bacterium]|nr:GNAT family N-acetyltransferase [bacterium]
MIFEDKQITLKDGRTAILKSPCVEDADKMLHYIKNACSETDFLVRYPEEWNSVSVASEEKWIRNLRKSQNALAITCCVDSKIAGNCEINFRGGLKTSHRATVAIA